MSRFFLPMFLRIINFVKKQMAKGRDKSLIIKRDELLCRRYYYWTEVRRLRFDDALKILSNEEFFLSEERILSIIRAARKIDGTVPPVPKVRMPRLTYKQLSLFTDEAGYPVAQIHRDNRI
jgi:hypothetical protein